MRSYPGLSSEAMLYAARGNKEKGPDIVRNILIGQAVNSVGNAVLDFFEPAQRKKQEEKDFGDKTRDAARGLLNLGTGVNQALLLARGLGVMDNQPKGAAKGETQNFNEKTPASPPPRPGASETAPSMTEGYAPVGKMPNEPALTERTRQGEAAELTANLMQGFSPYGLLKGSEPTMTERTRRGEELVKAARAERMPGLVVTDLSAMVDDDTMNRLRGLEREAASYPKKKEEPSDYEKGVAAGMEAMAMRNLQSQAPSQTIDVNFTEPERRSTPYVAPETSSNPLLSREPMGFNETFGVKGGVPMARDKRKEEDAESLANFYANLPTNPETGEREVGNFATNYLVSKGAVAPETVMVVDPEVDTPRNSGGLLQGQLRGETLYNQQENREPFVQDQQMDAINSGDEQGPGFTSGSLADMFKQQAQAMAQSDARLYRNVGERIGNMRQILSGAEEGVVEPEPQKLSSQLRGQLGSLGESLGKLTRTVDDKLQREENSLAQRQQELRQDAAQDQMKNFMSKMLEENTASNERIQKQVAARETPSFVPTPDMVGNYVKPEFRAGSEQPSVRERLRTAGIEMQGAPAEFDGDGIGMRVEARGEIPGREFESLNDIGAQSALQKAGVSAQEASDYWIGKLKSEGLLGDAEPAPSRVAPSKTLSAEPTVKKTTIIEETVPAAQTRMSPVEASEKLRRIQTSGRPNARQEAQDFLQSIKGQMING